MNRGGGCAVAIAFWTAAVHCRFCAPKPDRKAPEDWRSPKPGGPSVGSRKAPFRFYACTGTMTRGRGCAVAIASWTAAVLCRFCARRPDRKAPEDGRSPKPGGSLLGSRRAPFRFYACTGTMNLFVLVLVVVLVLVLEARPSNRGREGVRGRKDGSRRRPTPFFLCALGR